MNTLHKLSFGARFAVASSICFLVPYSAKAQQIEPAVFARDNSPQILQKLGANDSLVKVYQVAIEKMSEIMNSTMVQGMARGSLVKDEWDVRYMKADALYIYNLGIALAERSKNESDIDSAHVMEFANMFLGYGKHFERLSKYGLSSKDHLFCSECDAHIAMLSKGTSIKEFYIAILTDMIPYVVFANYLLHCIDPNDDNPWMEYAQKYGDLNNKYAKNMLSNTIAIANEILVKGEVDEQKAKQLFVEGFTFEEWFIRNAFTEGFTIKPSPNTTYE